MATETSSAVGNGYAGNLGGTVETVLSSARIAPPPATLEEARNQPGRRERIEEITRRIESEGIKYVFFQQVSITGRVMGKGVVASFFPQVAEKGYQLVYGASANLFTDRHGNYIGFGPEESELAAVADLDTFAVLRAGNIARLASFELTAADLKRRGRHPELGPVTLEQLLATWVAHDLSHLGQIARVMGKAYTEAVGPWAEYLPMLRPREMTP